MTHDCFFPPGKLSGTRQVPVENQIRNFKERGSFSKLFNRVATITKNTSVTINIRNIRSAGSGVHVTIIIDTKTDAITARCDLFEVSSTKGAMFTNREFVFFTSAAVNDSEGARAATRSRSARGAETREMIKFKK